ncbi:MAG: YhgE/Pip family protein [Mycobacteriaceae bacterium]|uniref:YhgE/Pip domain-containing protein n=1 Tax=Corynebacterium sp. TaxID=1720 RepID=UPI003F96B413
MKNILTILRNDLRGVRNNVMTAIVLFGLVIIPLVFSVFNVLASWDPFENTDELEIAVASADEGHVSDLAPMDLNLGDQVLSQLSRNDQIDWVITNEDDAIEGTKSGDYYASIVLPPDFSTSMLTFYVTGTEPSTLDMYTNEKKNALSEQITMQGADGMIEQINDNFTRVVSNVGLGVVSSLSDYMEQDDTKAAIDRIEARVENVGARLESGAETVRSLTGLLDSTVTMVDGASNIVGAAGAQFDDSGDGDGDDSGIGDGTGAITGLDSTLQSATDSLETALNATGDSYGAVSQRLDSLFDSAGSASSTTASTFTTLSQEVGRQVTNFESLRDTLESNVSGVLPDVAEPGFDRMMAQLDAAIDRSSDLQENLAQTGQDIEQGNQSAQETRQSTEEAIGRAQDAASGAVTSYQEDLKPQLSQLGETLGTIGDNVDSVKEDIDGITATMSGSDGSLGNTLERLRNGTTELADSLDGHAGRFNELTDALSTAGESGDFSRLAGVVGDDPEALASQLSSPIDIERDPVFPVASFGAGMAPMYIVLSLWVGAVLATVLVRTNVPGSAPLADKEDQTYTRTQAFFGRFGIFALIGLAQSTLVALGQIIFVQVEAEHPFLLLVSAWVTSLVFMLIVYTLVLSFGSVGKAISVFLLVIQISGAGGAYPLTLLPGWVQAVSPWLPATYAMDAVRSAIAGIYRNDLWINLGMLLLFVVPALILGLLLRRALDGYNRKTTEALEATKIMN